MIIFFSMSGQVLISCEFSGVLRRAMRAKGIQAYSCDLLPSTDNSPFHFVGDVFDWLDYPFKALIAFPPCDRLLVAGSLHWEKWQASGEQQRGIEFFMAHADCPIPLKCIENPVGIISSYWRKPDQIIQPWMFGHKEQKATCVWLEGLPPLVPTNNVYNEMMLLPKRERERVHHESPGIKNGLTRSQRRAITFEGIADAMADQWAHLLI